eukprot:RCo044715
MHRIELIQLSRLLFSSWNVYWFLRAVFLAPSPAIFSLLLQVIPPLSHTSAVPLPSPRWNSLVLWKMRCGGSVCLGAGGAVFVWDSAFLPLFRRGDGPQFLAFRVDLPLSRFFLGWFAPASASLLWKPVSNGVKDRCKSWKGA